MRYAFPPAFEDTQIALTEGQVSALSAYDRAVRDGDDEAIRETRYHLDAWDRHFGRESTILMRDKKVAAERFWSGWVFENGAGI